LYDACGLNKDDDKSRLEFVEADLMSSSETWDEAVRGCDACVHSAGPVVLHSNDPKKELVDPILKGIENVFGACERSETVKIIVYTSSVTTLSHDFAKWKTHVYGPEDWNSQSTLSKLSYPYAKTLGEKRVMEWAKTLNLKSIRVATVLPHTIMGPMLQKTHDRVPDTMDMPIRGMLDGEVLGAIHYTFGVVDVRDVATVHALAMENLLSSSKYSADNVPRYICWSESVKMKPTLAQYLAEAAPERKRKLPRFQVPSFIALRFIGFVVGKGEAQYVRKNADRSPQFNVTNVEHDLGLKFRSAKVTIRDTVEWIERAGLFKTKV